MFDLIGNTIDLVANQDNGSLLMVFGIGILFGVVIQWSRVDTFEKIGGFSMLKDFTLIKLVLMATGISAIGLYFMVDNELASYSAKPVVIGGLVIGGLLFGTGMALFGKCPGTGSISLAEGRVDVVVGIAGGLAGGIFYTLFFTDLKPIVGENLGKLQIVGLFEDGTLFILLFGAMLIGISFLIPNRELHYDKE